MLSWLDDYFSKEEIKTGLRILFVCVLICTGIFVPAMCATTMVSRSAPDFDDALERCASLCAKQVQSVKLATASVMMTENFSLGMIDEVVVFAFVCWLH